MTDVEETTAPTAAVPTINAKYLDDMGACEEELETFVALFGDQQVALTEPLARLVAEDFDWYWAAHRLLLPKGVAAWIARDRAAEIKHEQASEETLRAAETELHGRLSPDVQRVLRSVFVAYRQAQAVAFVSAAVEHGLRVGPDDASITD